VTEDGLRFDEVWMSREQRVALADLARSTSKLQGAVIEIGTWQGLSAIPIANAIAPADLHVVDHWRGSSDIPAELSSRDNFSIFMDNVGKGTQGNICVHVKDWHEFADEWQGPIRFIHLDAEHTQEEVQAQVDWALPFMVKGGIIAGDDYNWIEVRKGVLEMFPGREINVRWFKLWWVEI
jgi:predicted O-methyltransferase YrrM